jgi:hypothetical protein
MGKKGEGRYQRISHKITTIQVVYGLLDKPHTYEELREITHIQRNRLSDILKSLVDDNLIISHKLTFSEEASEANISKHDLKLGHKYYILNLDNERVQRYIVDPTPFYLGNYLDYYDTQKNELKKYGKHILFKIENISFDIAPRDYASEKLIEGVRDEAKMDFPYVKKEEEEIKNEMQKKKNTADDVEYENLINKFSKVMNERTTRINIWYPYMKPKFLDFMENFIKAHKNHQYDFLIYFTRQFSDQPLSFQRLVYLSYWKMMKEHTH